MARPRSRKPDGSSRPRPAVGRVRDTFDYAATAEPLLIHQVNEGPAAGFDRLRHR